MEKIPIRKLFEVESGRKPMINRDRKEKKLADFLVLLFFAINLVVAPRLVFVPREFTDSFLFIFAYSLFLFSVGGIFCFSLAGIIFGWLTGNIRRTMFFVFTCTILFLYAELGMSIMLTFYGKPDGFSVPITLCLIVSTFFLKQVWER
jgi:hypothetical protein